jgi:hypothetical protein
MKKKGGISERRVNEIVSKELRERKNHRNESISIYKE